MAFLLDDTTLKVENYIIVIEFYKLEFVKEDYVCVYGKQYLAY